MASAPVRRVLSAPSMSVIVPPLFCSAISSLMVIATAGMVVGRICSWSGGSSIDDGGEKPLRSLSSTAIAPARVA